jgi:hypothetical protein
MSRKIKIRIRKDVIWKTLGNLLEEMVKIQQGGESIYIVWWGDKCATLNQYDQFTLVTHRKVMGCGNVFSFLSESRGLVEFYRIGSRFDFVALVAEPPSDLNRERLFGGAA